MDARSTTSEPQHLYPQSPWTSTTASTVSTDSSSGALQGSQSSESPPDTAAFPAAAAGAAQYPSQLDFLPFLFPQQNVYHAQLLHYNKLISPARGGGLQTTPLPPLISSPHVQAGPRSRSSSRVSLKEGTATKGAGSGGNGSRANHNTDKPRSVITSKEGSSKMAASKHATEHSKNIPQRHIIASSSTARGASHSSSVPSTPHQHARQFSFESRDPSPNAAANHSPRSVYSETNSTLPSLKPLPPRLGGCKYETAQANSRRRIPYSVGNDRLEKLDLRTVKANLTEDEEAKLTADMRVIYDKLLPTSEVEEKRRKLVQKLEKIFNDEWPDHDIRVHLFGSSGNLLCADDSDVDICITTSWRELEGVCIIADLLARRGMEKVVCISAAKVPIVKIWDPELSLACDMNVNNTMALENTRMIRTYVEIDPRVRQLAMIIKYWTRRRIVNDAAFGGTLSSYTWICLIIAFLQLRSPPVLPALHQLPYKMPKTDGGFSDFADNLKKLRGFGNKNKSSVSELLFQFFRFYAHEFDYDKHVLSVRQGKLVTKQDKKWNYVMNNQLCVEEPFNISRNLGNTVDEYSFRGVHLELRRAFDLLSQAKFEETCEQYVFPKEEERVWTRPAQQPRPVLVRSSSQTHSGRGGRGGHRGGRHNNNFQRNGGNNRRASSTIPGYDASMFMAPLNMQQDMTWFQNPHYPFQYIQQDLMTQIAYQESMRQLHMYAQSPAFLQHQALGQQRGAPSASPPVQQQSGDRSRTNSVDTAPAQLPLRPDLYALYGMGMPQAYYAQASGYGTYPSSPASATPAGTGQEFRRSLQRSTVLTEGGASASSSSLRSQSQPAHRSGSAAATGTAYHQGIPPPQASTTTPRHAHGVPIPSFLSDEADFDETPKAVSDSPDSIGQSSGFFSARSLSPTRQLQPNATSGIAFGDIAAQPADSGKATARAKTRGMSRSPSPLGHARATSVGGASSLPLSSAPFVGAQSQNWSRPLVVNGSCLQTPAAVQGQRQSSRADSLASEESATSSVENPLHISTSPPWNQIANGSGLYPLPVAQGQPAAYAAVLPERQAAAANGSTAPQAMPQPMEEASFRERIAMMNSFYLSNQFSQQEVLNGNTARLSPSARQRLVSRQPQSGVIAPLDLAVGDNRVAKPANVDAVHLSPVYEARTPSPTVRRKEDGAANLPKKPPPPLKAANSLAARESVNGSMSMRDGPQTDDRTKAPKPQTAGNGAKLGQRHESGHLRAAKSEGDGGWQKAGGKGKKKATNPAAPSHQAELPPRNESERKGG